MREITSSPRVLLKRLRVLMAEAMEPQERLDRIVREIAHNMVAEVCSFYVLRSDHFLELYATQGLKQQSVHHAQLRVGQGLVGTIAATARPLNLDDAQKHPAFTYLPETGEEIYSSFLGVPILRAGRSLGVLVVQNRKKRKYSDDEIEALETVAMVLAEMIAAGELPGFMLANVDLDMRRPLTLTGHALNDGIGLGHVVLHEPRVVVTNLFNEDSELELQRLAEAIGTLRLSIDDMLSRGDVANEGEHREVLEAYRMFANDRGWVRRLEEAIKNGLTAEAAVEKVQSDTRARLIHLTDASMRERLSDFDDLANRLAHQLMGHDHHAAGAALPKNSIIIARSMGAAELLDYPRDRLRGLVLEDATPTSHVTIVARALGIPVVGQAKGVVSLSENGDSVIIDGDDGKVHLRPQLDVEKAYAEKARFRARRQQLYRELRDIPSVTKDEIPIKLLSNIGLLIDLPHHVQSGAAGIGLFRTELQFMIASTFPRTSQQEALYRSVYREIGDEPVTFRTLDIGGDKILPYFRAKASEENPALGWRAIRLTLDRPALMRMQLRALLKASEGRELRLMLPMVTELSEVARTKALIEREKSYLTRFGHPLPHTIKLGAMIEVPSLLYQLDELMQIIDFASVGSNDLFQFLMAVDRGNTQLSHRFEFLSKPFLRALRTIIEAGKRHQTPITLCGELAGYPLAAMSLIGLGYESLSMTPSAVGPVKAMVLSLNAKKLAHELLKELAQPSVTNLHNWLVQFSKDNNIII